MHSSQFDDGATEINKCSKFFKVPHLINHVLFYSLHGEKVCDDLSVTATSATMAKRINREMDAVQAGTFEMMKNSSEVPYWKNGEQSEIYCLCQVLSYICELCFMVTNPNDSMITFKCCTGVSVVREIPSQMLLDDPKLFLDLKSSSQDCLDVINFGQLHFRQKGVTRKTQVWVFTGLV